MNSPNSNRPNKKNKHPKYFAFGKKLWRSKTNLLLELLEDRTTPVTGGLGPGGFLDLGPTSDLVLWVDAGSLSLTDGANVDAWGDQSGRGNDLGNRQNTVTYVANDLGSNNLPTVQFGDGIPAGPGGNATRGWLEVPQLLDDGIQAEIFVVLSTPHDANTNDGGQSGGFMLVGEASNHHYTWSDGNVYENFSRTDRPGFSTNADDQTVTHVYNVTGDDDGAWKMFVNGNERGNTATQNPDYVEGRNWAFGRGESTNNGNTDWDGKISEIIMSNRPLTDVERIIVTNYLHSKYDAPTGLGTGVFDIYSGDTAANGDHDFDLFGVGRDSDGDEVLDAGAAGFGIQVSSLTDGDFILAAHDGGTGKTTNDINAPGVLERFGRTWYIDFSGPKSSTFTFDYSDAGLTRDAEDVQFDLLFSPDGTNFTSVASVLDNNPANDTFTFTSLTGLNDGWYTLGEGGTLPVVSTSPGALFYLDSDPAEPIDGTGLSLVDTDDNISDATIEITGNASPGDVLGIQGSLPAGITVSSSTNTQISLTDSGGSVSSADWQTALRQITFSTTAGVQSIRTVTYTVHDDEFPGDPTHEGVDTRQIEVRLIDDGRYIWDGDSDGDGDGINWTDPLNWNRDQVPGASDIAVLEDLDIGDVDVTGMAPVGEIRFENSSDSFSLIGGQIDTPIITHVSNQTNEITVEVDVAGLLVAVDAGQLNLTNQNNDATGTVNVGSGGILGAALDPLGGALGNLNVDLNGGILDLLPGAEETIVGAQAYLFDGNDTDLPGDSSQLATKILEGNVWFPDQDSVVNFWGDEILGLNNSGNPVDPQNFGHTYIGTLVPDDGDANPGETLTVEFGHTSADDANRIRIDLNGNGIFEDVVAEGDEDPYDADRGGTFATNKDISLVEGQEYLVALQGREGGGQVRLQARVSYDNGGSFQNFDVTDLNTQAVPIGVMNGTLTVSGDSTVRLASGVRSDTITNLVMNSAATLMVDSVDMKQGLAFSNVSLQGGDATFDSTGMPNVTLSNISETAPTNIIFNGDATFTLDTNNTYTGTTTINPDTTVIITQNNSLGTTDGGTIVNAGGALVASGLTTIEPLTISGIGNPKFEGALSKTTGGDVFWNGPIKVAGDAEIRSTGGNEFFFDEGEISIDPGMELTLDADNRLNIRNNATIVGDATTSLQISGTDRVDMETTIPGFDGTIVVGSDGTGGEEIFGRYDVHAVDGGFGSAVGPTRVEGTEGSVLIRNNRTHTENFFIEGNGRGTEGAIRSEGGTNVIDGTVTLTDNADIFTNNSTLTITGQVSGPFTLNKTGTNVTSRLILESSNPINDFLLSHGQVRISQIDGLGGTTSLDIDNGESLEFNPGDGNTFTYDGGQALQGLNINNGTISSISGSTILDIPITVGILGDVNFSGDGDLTVKQGFGNGDSPINTNFLNHYGFDRTGDDRDSLNLHLNGGMLNGGSPTTYVDFTGETLLTSGPQGNGLNFDSDADFVNTGAIDQNDNYKNLFIGFLNSTETGDWEFRNSDRDDWGTLWVDIDQDGVFESNDGNLGSNNGELLAWNDNGTKTVNLTNPLGTGQYLVAFTHLEGGGGSRIEYSFKSPSMGSQVVINPAAPAQAGLWSGFQPVTPDTNVTKDGDGVLTLFGDNTFSGSVTVSGGTVLAANDNAFGLPGGDVILSNGTTVGFQQDMMGNDITVSGDNIIGADSRGANQSGTIVNLFGNNTFQGDITASMDPADQDLTITSESGQLTIGQAGDTLDVQFSKLNFDGAGNTVVNSEIVGLTTAQSAGIFQAYLFTGNDTDLPGDPSQIASKIGSGEVWFPQEANSLDFWGNDLLGVGNAGNPVDPNNWAATYISELTIPGVGNQNIQLRHTSADDANRILIDLDQSGSFDGGAEDPYGQDRGGNFTTGSISVPRGVPIPIALQMREGGGGSRIQPEISFDNGTTWHRFDTAGIDIGGVNATFGLELTPSNQLMKMGAGTVTITGNNSTFEADYTVMEGTLVATSNQALGSTTGNTFVEGGTLSLQGVTAVSETIVVGDAIITPEGGGLGATQIDFQNTGDLQFNITNANGINGTVEVTFDFTGTGLPGINDQFELDRDGNTVSTQPASAAIGDTISFPGIDLGNNGTYMLQASFTGTPIAWQGDVSSDWNTGGNWVGDVVPGPMDLALFNDADSVSNTVDLSSAGPVGGVLFQNNTDTFTFTNGTLNTNALEQTGSGTTILDGSASITSSIFLGRVDDGLLQILNQNTSSSLTGGQWNLNGGTLNVTANGADTGLGATAVNVFLNGGTLDVDGVSTTTNNALGHYGFHSNSDANHNLDGNGGLMARESHPNFNAQVLLTNGPGNRGLDFNNDADFVASGAIGQNDNYQNLWVGTLSVPLGEGGNWEFRNAGDDDRGAIWIDLDRNGTFDAPGGLGTGENISWEDGGTKTVPLTAGEDYLVAFAHTEFGSGSNIDIRVKSPSMDSQVVVQPSDPAQAGWWSFTQISQGVLGNNITLDSDSTINISSPEIEFGNLTTTVSDVQLNVETDSAGSGLVFSDVTIEGNTTFNAVQKLNVQLPFIAEVTPANLTFQGSGGFNLPTDNTFSGQITIAGEATVDISTVEGLGSGDETDATGTFIQDSGSLRITGNLTFNNEKFTLSSQGNSSSPGAINGNGGGNKDIRTEINLAGDATLSNSGNTFFVSGGVATNGNEFEFNSIGGNIQLRDQPITGTGGVRITGGSEVFFLNNAVNTYDGTTMVEDNTRLRVRHDNSLGSSVGETIIRDQGTVLFEDGDDTHVENFVIEGNGRNNNEGALWNLNANNVIQGSVTFTGDTQIRSDVDSLTITGLVTGTGNLLKTLGGDVVFENPVNNFVGDTTITGGQLVITGANGLGSDPGNDLNLSGGGLLGFKDLNSAYAPTGGLTIDDGGFNNVSGNTTISFPLSPMGDLILSSDSGTFDVQSAINLVTFSDLLFQGSGGEIMVQQGFGNGNIPQSDNLLNHFGFDRTGDDRDSLNLHLNGGMLNNGSPTTYFDFTGQSILTSGPQGNGLNFDSDADFVNTGAIDQNDNYKNLFIGFLNTTETGNWEFRNSDRDDWGTLWVDIDQDGVFESTNGNLGSNNGELLAWNDNGTKTVNLTNPLGTGRYMVAFTHLEGGGGSRIEYSFKSPSMGSQVVINPADPSQAGLWSAFAPIFPDNDVVKTGESVVTLLGANSYDGDLIIEGGAVVAGNSDALSFNDTEVNIDGGTLGFTGGITVDHDAVSLAGEGGAGFNGAISNVDGNNTFNVGNIAVDPFFEGTTGIGSESGTLSINSLDGSSATTLDLQNAGLNLGGDGDLNLNADITENTGSQTLDIVQGFLFTGNDIDLPDDSSQIASMFTSDEVFFAQEVNSLQFWGDSLLGVGNSGNPSDPNNWAQTFIGDFTIDDGDGNPGENFNVNFQLTSNDDAATIWVDLDRDGAFSGSEALFGTNGSGGSPSTSQSLTEGLTYSVALSMREGGGGSRLQPEFNLGDGNGFQRFDPGNMINATYTTTFNADNTVTKDGAGTVTLLGDNSGLVSSISIKAGTLVADGTNAGTASLGAPGGGISIDDNAGLGLANFGNLTAALDDISIGNGSLINVAGDNTISTNITVEDKQSGGEVTIESLEPGSVLTVASDIDLRFSKLTVDGAGDVIIDGIISATHNRPPFTGQSGIFTYNGGGETFDALIDNDGTNSWFLVGRGREGWQFDVGGQGNVDDVSKDIGTPAAFSPAYYSETIINDLLTSVGIDMTGIEVRIRRAADPNGTDYQELRWRDFTGNGNNWTWDFDDSQYGITLERVNAPAGLAGASVGTNTGGNTRDYQPAGNDADRVFTWPWSSHNSQRGFSYGSSVSNGSNSPTSFLWEAGNENHAIPYSEVYIRPLSGTFFQPATFVPDNNVMKMGDGTLTLTAANLYEDGTSVMEGTLLVNNIAGSGTGTGPVEVLDGGILGGTGTISGDITTLMDGTTAPGTSPGILNAGANFTLMPGSNLSVELNGTTPGSGHDQMVVNGIVDVTNANLDVLINTDNSGFDPAPGDTFVIIKNDGANPVASTFSNAPMDDDILVVGFNAFQVTYDFDEATGTEGAGNDVALITVNRAPIAVDDPDGGIPILPYTTTEDDPITVPVGPDDLLANDIDEDMDPLSVVTPSTNTIQDFDTSGTSFTLQQNGANPPAAEMAGGPTGDFLRLITDGTPNNKNNAIVFDQTHFGPFQTIQAEFDFRAAAAGFAADGFSFLLIPTADFGFSGNGPEFTAEEPNVPGAFGVGFDLHPADGGENHVSIHWNGGAIANTNANPVDLDAGVFHHATIEVTPVGGGSNVTVTLSPDVHGGGGADVIVHNNVFVAGLNPYESRVMFRARTGGRFFDGDLDNINVSFGTGSTSVFSDNFAQVAINSDGSFTYNPSGQFEALNQGEPATDTFSYTITDGTEIDTADVTISLVGVNDVPSVADHQFIIPESGSLTGELFGGDDIDVEDDQGSLAYTIASFPSAGMLVNNNDGTYSFDTNGDFDGLALGEIDTVTFTYTATDMRGAESTPATVTIQVNGENNDPVANDDPTPPVPGLYQVNENGTLNLTAGQGVLANDTDADVNDVLTVDTMPGSETQQTFDGGGTPSTPEQSGGGPGPVVTAGGPDGSFLRLTTDGINNQNNAIAFDQTHTGPFDSVVAEFDFRATSVGAAADGFSFLLIPTADFGSSGNGPAFTAEEPNVADTFGVGFDLHPAASQNHVSLHWDGIVIQDTNANPIVLDNGIFHHAKIEVVPVAGGAEVTVTLIPDVFGLAGQANVVHSSVFIAGLNPYESRVMFRGRTGGLNVGVDLDNIDVRYESPPKLITTPDSGNVILNSDGSFSYDPNSQFEFLAAGESVNDTFDYTVQDMFGGTDTANVSIQVNGQNDSISNIVTVTPQPSATENDTLTITDLISFTDLDLTDFTASATANWSITVNWGDGSGNDVISRDGGPNPNLTLNLDVAGQQNAGNATPSTANEFSLDASHTYTDDDADDTYTVTITLNDGNGSIEVRNVDVTITNTPPTANDDDYLGADGSDEDNLLTINAGGTPDGVLGNDTDPGNDTLNVIEIQGLGVLTGLSDLGATVTMQADGSFTYDPQTSAFLQTLVDGETVQDTFTYTVDDGDGGMAMATVTIDVQGINGIEVDMNLDFPPGSFGANPGNDAGPDIIDITLNGGNLDITVNSSLLRSVPSGSLGNGFAPHDLLFTGSGDADTLNLGSLGTVLGAVTIDGSGGNNTVEVSGAQTLGGNLSFSNSDAINVGGGDTLNLGGNNIVWVAGNNVLNMSGGAISNIGAITEIGGNNTINLDGGTLGTGSTDITVDDFTIGNIVTYTRTGGTLTVNNNLSLGGPGGNADRGNLTQTGGAVVVGNNLLYGGATATNQDTSTYDLNGGTLNVTGNIQHASGVRGHLYVDDPNALTVGGNILIQSFRTGDDETGSHIVNPGQTLETTGTLLVGNTAIGTLGINSPGNVAANMTVSDNTGAAGSILTLDNAATLQVNGETDVADQNNSAGTISLLGGSMLTQNGDLDVGEEDNANGQINIDGGSTLQTTSGRVDLGVNNNAQGHINVINGLLDINAGGLYIAGDGTNDSNTQGSVTVGPNGQVDVNGGNTEVGRGGTGTLIINGGLFNQNTNNLVLAQTGGSGQGTVTINSGTLNVGDGNGSNSDLNMNGGTNGAIFNHNGGDVFVERDIQMATNAAAGSMATYNLDAGSGSLDIGQHLIIGENNVAEFNYESGIFSIGGTIYVGGNPDTGVGAHPNSDGTLNIAALGGTPTMNTGQFEVGRHNVGVVNQDGGDVNVQSGNLVIGQLANSNGTYNLAGGTVTVTNDLNFNGGVGLFNLVGGTLTINDQINMANGGNTSTFTLTDGVLDMTNGDVVNRGGPSVFNFDGGRLKDVNVFNFDLIQNGTTLQIGADNASDMMTVQGNYTHNAGSLEIELDGLAGAGNAGGNDLVDVNGMVTLGSTLDLSLNFSPASGTNFLIIDNDGLDAVNGTFAGLPEGQVFNVGSDFFQITYQGGDGNDVVLRSFDPDNPDLIGTPGGDDFIVREDGGSLNDGVEVLLNDNVIFSRAKPPLQSITINGLSNDDTLTVDFAHNGHFSLPSGVTFIGDVDNDTLFVTGETFLNVPHNLTGPASGDLTFMQGAETLEVFYDTTEFSDTSGTSIDNLQLNLPGSNDEAFLEDFASSQLRSNNGTFSTTIFGDPTQSLVIVGSSGSDSITTTALPDLSSSLSIESEIANINGPLTLGSSTAAGDLTVTATTINLNSVINTDGSGSDGNVSLTGVVNLGADVVIDAHGTSGGDVDFFGTIDGNHDLTINTGGTTTFHDEVGGTTPLSSLTTDGLGSVIINANITTNGGTQTFNDPATIGSDLTLTDMGTTGITFGQTVDGTTDYQEQLTVVTTNAAAQILFTGDVGSNIPLRGLEINNAGLATLQGNLQDDRGEGASGTTLAKMGAGQLDIIGANNNYSGQTTINGGSVNLQGTLTGSGDNFVLNANNVSLVGGGQILDRTVEIPTGVTGVQINGLSQISNVGGAAVDVAGTATLTDTIITGSTTGVNVSGTANLTTSVIQNNLTGIEVDNATLVLNRTGGGNQIVLGANSAVGLLFRGVDAQVSDGIQIDNFGNTSFEAPSLGAGNGFFIQFANGAFFEMGEPDLVFAGDSTFNGLLGSDLAGNDLNNVGLQIEDFNDISSVGLVFFDFNSISVENGQMNIIASQNPDRITVNATNSGAVSVRIGSKLIVNEVSGKPSFDLNGFGEPMIKILGLDGDDDIRITGNVSAEVFGGQGDDDIRTQDGRDVIFGGAGRDVINSGGGDDIVVGGLDMDKITTVDGDDLLFAGETSLTVDELKMIETLSLTDILNSITDPDFAERQRNQSDRLDSGRGNDTIYLRLSTQNSPPDRHRSRGGDTEFDTHP